MKIFNTRTSFRDTLLSTLLFCAAFIITCIFHESGHAFFVRYLGLQGTWHHNRVDFDYENATVKQSILVCLGGSLFTAIQLLVCYPLCLKLRRGGRVFRLFICWLAFWSVIQLIGYFVIGSFPLWNDISGVYNLTRTPWALRIAVSLAAVLSFRFMLNPLTKPIIAALDVSVTADLKEQAKIIILFPSFIATAVLAVINLPIENYLSLIYPLSTPLFVLSTYFRVANAKGLQPAMQRTQRFALPLLGVLLLCLIAIFRILSNGVPLNTTAH